MQFPIYFYHAFLFLALSFPSATHSFTLHSPLILVDIEREGSLDLSPLLRLDDDRVLPGVARRALHHVQRQPRPLGRRPQLHRRVLQRPPVLEPRDRVRGLGRRLRQLRVKRGRAVSLDGEGGGEGLECGGGRVFAGDVDDERARGEALAHVVEGLARVGAGVLRENLLKKKYLKILLRSCFTIKFELLGL